MHGWVVLAAALTTATPAPDQVRDRVGAIAARGGYQRDLPAATAPPPGPASRTEAPRRPERSPPVPPPPLPPPIVLPAFPLQWIVLGVLAVLLIWAAIKVTLNWKTSTGSASDPPADETAPAKKPSPGGGLVTSADQLARAGRFAEALHALLLQAIAELSRRREVAGSLTTRELLRSATAALKEEGRTALAELASAVERVHFGDYQAHAEDYEQGLLAYRRFADACRR